MENGIQLINLSEIRPSKLNPRKTFSEDSIAELAESIGNMGVLQPIIVRPIPDKKTKFEIVCGERRYRASIVAGHETIPAILRMLTDTDAFELMITENLQREDVKPLEEAEAYQKLITKMKYDIASLCHRFAKSETYIRHRIKLNDLIPDFRNLLESEEINISMALEICKIDDKYQRLFFDEYYAKESYWGQPKNLKEIKYKIANNFTNLLSTAKFSLINDEFSHAGPCSTCLKNTACNGLLFPDEPESGRCMDKECFDSKTKQHIISLAKIIQENEPGILIVEGKYANRDDDFLNNLINDGIDVCRFPENHNVISKPSAPDAPERNDCEDEEDFIQEMKEFEDDMKTFKNEMNEYIEDIKQGRYRKALIVTGKDAGDIVFLRDYSPDNGAGSEVRDVAYTAELNMKAEIVELEMKDKRNNEISFDKSYQQVKVLIYDYNNKEAGKEIFENEKQLSNNENDAMILFMISNCGGSGFVLNILKSYGYKGSYLGYNDIDIEIVQKLTIAQKNIIKRAWLMHQIKSTLGISTRELDKLFIEIVKENYPDQVNQILLDEQGKYLKKKEIIDKKIEEIEVKLIKSVTK